MSVSATAAISSAKYSACSTTTASWSCTRSAVRSRASPPTPSSDEGVGGEARLRTAARVHDHDAVVVEQAEYFAEEIAAVADTDMFEYADRDVSVNLHVLHSSTVLRP